MQSGEAEIHGDAPSPPPSPRTRGEGAAPANCPIGTGDTVADARRALTRALAAHGIETPELDARVLLAHCLGLDHAGLLAAADQRLQALDVTRIAAAALRRISHEPVARIVGRKEFWGLDLHLSPATLVPRPETETVVEGALAALRAEGRSAATLHVADLGTGSGALLLALLRELAQARGVGTDLSLPALQTAQVNAARLGLDSRATFAACDFGAALGGGFDVVVANPPYIASGEIGALAPEVREHDPRLALDGGADGLDGYRSIVADAPRLLAPGGHLVLELGAGQEVAVAGMFRAGPFAVGRAAKDLSGIPRALPVRRVA